MRKICQTVCILRAELYQLPPAAITYSMTYGFQKVRVLCLLGMLWIVSAMRLQAGWIEDRDGQTVIHVRLFDLPDPSSADVSSRAGMAAVDAFKQEFPRIVAKKYKARYQANPARYGIHNWDRVSVELERFTGITVKGVEVDLLAIAGGMAPDVLYVNFR